VMWGTLLARILARPGAQRAAVLALAALAITLFLLNLRRQGERVGRAAERLDQLERTHAIQRQMLDAASRRPRSRYDLLERLREGGF
jgi:type II secretory pathway component PulJ